MKHVHKCCSEKEYISGIVNITEFGKKSLETFTLERLTSRHLGEICSQSFIKLCLTNQRRKCKIKLRFSVIYSPNSSSHRGDCELGNYPPNLMHYTVLHECKNKAHLGEN